MEEYVSFILLLASLYIVSGGIVIHIARKATPLANTLLLLTGAVLANIFGTTGASMLLIRPYLRMNAGHIRPYHVVFFIFLVSNIGGLLTPIGDPPLFLGYLAGIPFWWIIRHCYLMWILAVGLILIVFFIRDFFQQRKFPRSAPTTIGPPFAIDGLHNLLFIVLIIFAVFRPGLFDHPSLPTIFFTREVLMSFAAVASLLTTPTRIHSRNEFTYAPIREVAILFLGIFSAMAPALAWVNANAARLHLQTPGRLYFTSGALSSILDNAPTYMTFLQVELAKAGANLSDAARIQFLLSDPAQNLNLVAISLGAVLFGACTYIGNGPNFMVKSIAEASGIKMPHFAEYIYGYALAILLPVYLLIWLIFL